MADNGVPVFPVGKTKRPVWSLEMAGLAKGQGGFKMASTDPDRVEELFTDPRVAKRITGIAIPTGKITGRTVVDVDCGRGKKNAASAKAWLEKNRQTTLWGATAVRTKSGGLQYYCAYQKDIPTTGNLWADGVDSRNDGGFIVVPPFMGYKFERQTDPEDWPAPPPVPANKVLRKEREITGGETPPEVVELARIMSQADGEDQGWHTAAVRLTAHLVGAGWSDAEILRHAVQWTTRGFTHRETFEDLCVMIAGARAKYKRERSEEERARNAIEMVKLGIARLNTEQRRDLHKALGELINGK